VGHHLKVRLKIKYKPSKKTISLQISYVFRPNMIIFWLETKKEKKNIQFLIKSKLLIQYVTKAREMECSCRI